MFPIGISLLEGKTRGRANKVGYSSFLWTKYRAVLHCYALDKWPPLLEEEICSTKFVFITKILPSKETHFKSLIISQFNNSMSMYQSNGYVCINRFTNVVKHVQSKNVVIWALHSFIFTKGLIHDISAHGHLGLYNNEFMMGSAHLLR
jgi:hypothetical protein